MTSEDISYFLHIFIEESADRFEELNQDLVKLEDNPYDSSLLYSILRHVHSIKGSAGMFGFENLKQLAHRLEDLMEKVHENPELVSRDVMDVLFEGCDVMQGTFKRISDNDTHVELNPRERSFLSRLELMLGQLNSGGSLEKSASDFFDEFSLFRETIASLPGGDRLVELSHTLESCLSFGSDSANGAEGDRYLGEVNINEYLEMLNALIEKAQQQPLADNEAGVFFRNVDELMNIAAKTDNEELKPLITDAKESVQIFSDLELDFDSLQAEYYQEVLENLLKYTTTATAEPEKDAAAATSPSQKLVQKVQRKSVRIDETKIDHFLNSVGEMIILGEVFNNLQKRLASKVSEDSIDIMREFKEANSNFSKQVFHLQEALMDIRRVELRNVTASLSRLVRDTASSLGKRVNFNIIGENSVIDKSLLDDINSCLVHIVRNSCDHGIELPEQRQAAGKTPDGLIELEAFNEEGCLVVRVRDDGGGINLEKLATKALESGMVTEKELQQMSEKQIREFIFEDGLTTAQEVSEISGRGVGMGAVVDNLRKVGGMIEVRSELGKGTEFFLRIPLSIMLSVVDGLVIRSGGEGFIIPIRYVCESLVLAGTEINTYQGKGECINLRGKILPVLRLDRHFAIESSEAKIGVIIQNEDRKFCLAVDDIIDHLQVVIKRIDGLEGVGGIAGGALLGDGTIGLVINVDFLSTAFA